MRAAILEALGEPLVVDEVELRPPGAGEVVVQPLRGRAAAADQAPAGAQDGERVAA
jgi:Zn-dependent alcohol dehydrogenase